LLIPLFSSLLSSSPLLIASPHRLSRLRRYGEDKGIIPIAASKIFDNIRENKDPDLTIRVEASMLEIYM
jgi:hypothetical protein